MKRPREAASVDDPGPVPDQGPGPSRSEQAPARWVQALADALASTQGLAGEPARVRAQAFAARVAAGYRERTTPEDAAFDMAEIVALVALEGAEVEPAPADAPFGGHHLLAVRPTRDAEQCAFRLRRYGERSIELTRFLPVLESFGLIVVEVVPHLIGPGGAGQPAVHIDDVGVRTESPHGPEAMRFVAEIHGPRLVDALEALARGETDVDSLNRLVTVAGLDWRQVTVLRAYVRYRLQGATALSAAELVDPLVLFPEMARDLVGYFVARFDPEGDDPATGPHPTSPDAPSPDAPSPEAIARARCLAGLELVPHLQQDQVLRGYLQMIAATDRTNYFQVDRGGRHRPALTLKLSSPDVPDLPTPRPRVEAFVHGPSVEGIHLRAGLIARGGIRWSERARDFRTEVLDLAFAQVKKNAIIVPTGAKGGFVCRGPGLAGPTGPGPDEVRAAYRTFISALLDVTDNLVGGQVVLPAGVRARDGADPYLVVAADKGTATFSDLANALSEEYGFWLGDAFASGGSRGYDHKTMGITARGAWVAVRRHFHQLGIDVQTDPLRVVGVGDMSGDVFGNGMLRSPTIRLVAAFDHRHIFLDPEPDAATSFAERARLAALPRSSWADYRPEIISAGGGVWARDVKAVPLAPAARTALGVTAEQLEPPRLISAILASPVDLLWFGGIGTFVKAPDEPDSAVGDHANDEVRVTADQLRARVVAEGGNLGVTQRARVRYSRRGGRINADFIDNAAGVATSDREVNLKILLALAIDEGHLDFDGRDRYLVDAAPEVADQVLRQVDHSVVALTRAVGSSVAELDAYGALIDALARAGRLDRQVESLPTPEEMRVRRDAGAGLIRPELAVLLAYAKSDLVAAVEASSVVADPALADAVTPYFPADIRRAYANLIPRHRLYPQLVATDLGGEVVDQLGPVWAHETAAELGRGLADVAAAFWAARQVVGAGEGWAELQSRSEQLSADAEAALHAALGDAVAVLARAYLTEPEELRLQPLIGRDAAAADLLAAADTAADRAPVVERLVALGVEAEVADGFVARAGRAGVGQAGPVARRTGRSIVDADRAVRMMGRSVGLAGLEDALVLALAAVPAPGRLTVWLGRALLDDLKAWRRTAAIAALSESGPVDETVVGWEVAHEVELASVAPLLAASGPTPTDPVAVAALVLRRLRLTV